MWAVEMIGMKRREDTTYYAGYSSGVLVEFTLQPDTMPSVVGKVRKAVESHGVAKIDINDIGKHRAINWNLSPETYEALQTGAVIVSPIDARSQPSSKKPRQRKPRQRKQP